MVATERRRAAALDEELSNVSEEKAALRGALRVVESENARLRDTCVEMREIFEREGRSEFIPLPESPPATSVVRTLMGQDVASSRSKASTAAPTSMRQRMGSGSSIEAIHAASPAHSIISRQSSTASLASTTSQSRFQKHHRTLTIDVDLSQSAGQLEVGGTELDLSNTPQASSTTHTRRPAPSRLSSIPPPASMVDMNLPTPVGAVHNVPNPPPQERSRPASQASVRGTTPQGPQAGQQSRQDRETNSAPYVSALSRGGFSLGA